MKIGITGSLGYIASRLVTKLNRFGHDLVLIDNRFCNKTDNIYHLNTINTDINSTETIINLRQCDMVIHLAAVSGVEDCNNNLPRAMSTNILGTYNIAKICADKGIPLIFASSASTYFPDSNIYAKMKQIDNDIVEIYSKSFNFPAIVFLIGNVYGEYRIATNLVSKDTVINKFKKQSKTGKISVYKPGNQTRDYIHIDDVTDAIVKAVNFLKKERGFHKINLSTGKLTDVMAIAKHFSTEIEVVDNPRNEVVNMCKLPNKELVKKLGIKPRKLDLDAL